jgi:DNA-directed RNA polymerase sigma subunit (sigma70/sigma32)
MVALIRHYEDHAAPHRQHRTHRCKTHVRKVQIETEWLPARPGLKNEPSPKGQALTGRPHPQQHAAPNGDRAIQLYVRAIGQVKPLTPQEEIGMVARAKRGDRKARERLIKANLRRVVEISREYEDIGLSLLDLISEGNIGLLKAVDRFDPANGTRFSTCSTWWIKQSIKRALANQSKTIPLDNHRRVATPQLGKT